jgi:LPPG:FO 2-phospho-L-lactate transferase
MKIVAFSGGVGGAKLADGLSQILRPESLTIVVNTGDDFEHLGLHISPDLDTVCYTLAGFADPEKGWGRAADTFHVLNNIIELGGPAWFRLGDKDLSTHIIRTAHLKEGQSLSQITHDFCKLWGVDHSILPLSDDPVRTKVITKDYGVLDFQEYFVHHRCEPKVKGFFFLKSKKTKPAPGVIEAIQQADSIVFCPSNPWVSIDPFLSFKDIKSVLRKKMIVSVSPIIGNKAVKGPAAKMFSELGIKPSALAVFEHYRGLLTGFIIDKNDETLAKEISIPTLTTGIIMKSREDRRHLAQDVLDFISRLLKSTPGYSM